VRKTKRLALLFAIVAAATFALGPFLWQALTSLRPASELTSLGWPSKLTLASYVAVFQGRPFGRVLLNSAIVAGGTTALSIFIGGGASFALARLPLRGRSVILAAALLVSMFPPVATVSPLYLLIRALGLRDRLGGLILTDTTFALPMTLWILTGFFRSVPDELFRAARIDGCSPLQTFRKVFLPIAGPALATTAILVFIFSYNELTYALTFTSSPEARTVPVAITLFAGEHEEPWGEIAAASVIATLPLVAVTLIFQRRIVAGLTAGAVKG
jgi:multiple sugar transport system permease protein